MEVFLKLWGEKIALIIIKGFWLRKKKMMQFEKYSHCVTFYIMCNGALWIFSRCSIDRIVNDFLSSQVLELEQQHSTALQELTQAYTTEKEQLHQQHQLQLQVCVVCCRLLLTCCPCLKQTMREKFRQSAIPHLGVFVQFCETNAWLIVATS